MDGAWRRPPKSLADYGHTEPKRGAEWWGKSVLLTFALFKSEPPSGRNPKWPLPQQWICTQSNCVSYQAAFASKPAPTFRSRCLSQISVGCQSLATDLTLCRSCVDTYAAMRPVHATSIQCLYSGLSANPTFKKSTNFLTFGDKCRCCGYNAHTAVFGG